MPFVATTFDAGRDMVCAIGDSEESATAAARSWLQYHDPDGKVAVSVHPVTDEVAAGLAPGNTWKAA